ncbi:RNA exonuclease 1 homolog isoform X2 [Mixophyes fleayi]|uniref:RNA exonuclease 1 homolog isoform X2 n=1 Tax=Mixophyes fleayi TaxID=3061075 RepID=UPI003F4D7608
MLRSAGLFQLLSCPFTAEPGGCTRPHCQFQHVCPETTGTDTCTAAGAPRPVIGKNLQELERLNKAIEAVKNEVEEKQKTLLLYKSVTPCIKGPVPKTDINCNILATVQDEQRHTPERKDRAVFSAKNSNTVQKKYVVDRSCPATDLEYDPLLNYSAGFFGSTKEDENKSKSKHTCEEVMGNLKKKPRAASPIRLAIKLQESDDEDLLVIDVPPLNVVSKQKRANKVCGPKQTPLPLSEEMIISNEEKDSETNTMDILAPTGSSIDINTNSVTESELDTLHASESIGLMSCTNDNSQIFENCNDGGTFSDAIPISDLVESKNEGGKNLSVSINENVQEQTDLINIGKSGGENDLTSLPQENTLKQKNLIFPNADFSNPDGITTNITNLDECAGDRVLIDEHKCQQETECLARENEVIVVNSSSDTEDNSEEDTDISDSDDPMQECLRIFNEFTEHEAKKKSTQDQGQPSLSVEPFGEPDAGAQGYQDQSEMEIQEAKVGDLLPGQKKRIAHPSAKCDVKTSTSILVPYRGPSSQQIPHARILHVQHQALQITSAVKGGQAFVASSQKRIANCLSPAYHNFGQMVCLNLVEVQPVVPARSQLSGFFQGSTCATTLKSGIPQKRTIQMTPIKISTRKKSTSIVQESGAKVPHETRQRYVNSFVEEFLRESSSVQEAFDKALTEEKSIYDRCGSKNMYLNIAVNSLKKLRDQRNVPSGSQQSSSRELTSGSRKRDDKNELTGLNLYNLLKDYILSGDQLVENGYPRLNPDKPGCALIHGAPTKNIGADALRRVCCRCGETYSVTMQGKHVRKEECNYHSGKVLRHKVPGGMETRYSCCEAAVGSPGCQMAKLHVHDGQKENIDGFIKTFIKLQPSDGNPGIFSLDCEMCYTTHGLELTRVTVVDPSLQVAYDTFVKPDNEIIDYNTRFSGVTEDNLKNITTSIRDVQAILLNLISADTILIGHSLENDLNALKLIHDTVVDTSIVFPHRLGLPNKRALRNLIADYLRRIIQDNVGGHDSSEDATACMELMIWKVKEDTKGRR